MGDWVTRDDDRRWHVDLHALPKWLSLSLAAATVAVVVVLARRIEPDPAIPAWLPGAIDVAAAAIIGGVVLMSIRWLAGRRRGRATLRQHSTRK
jgi:hypothetical protein